METAPNGVESCFFEAAKATAATGRNDLQRRKGLGHGGPESARRRARVGNVGRPRPGLAQPEPNHQCAIALTGATQDQGGLCLKFHLGPNQQSLQHAHLGAQGVVDPKLVESAGNRAAFGVEGIPNELASRSKAL